jgi:hypothetical protein
MARYLGGLITADETKTIPANNYQDTSASGIWTLSEVEMLNKQSLWPTPGNVKPLVENVFSTDTYTGNATARSITTGIDLAGEGGLVWGKARGGSYNHWLYDTVRGAEKPLVTNTTNGEQSTSGAGLTAFTSDGFTLAASSWWNENHNTVDQVAWTFRKAPKFFDVLTYTGNGVNGRTVAHSLGGEVGMIIVKQTSANGEPWYVYHRSLGTNKRIYLNQNTAVATSDDGFWTTAPTSTEFSVAYNGTNKDGATYVAYLFGHDTSSGGMIQCGTVDIDGSNNASVNLGFEPQWFLGRTYTSQADWEIHDTQRNWNVGNLSKLTASDNTAETTYNAKYSWATSTGFETSGYFSGSQSLLYVAIRKAPMATPTTRASVFNVQQVGSAASSITNIGFPTDLSITKRTTQTGGWTVKDRMRGGTKLLQFHNTNAEESDTGGDNSTSFSHMDSFNPESSNNTNASYQFKKAPGFLDIVVYSGDGNDNRNITHNLGVVPDMMWMKMRTDTTGSGFTRGWAVTSLHLPNASVTNDTTLYLNTNAAEADEAILSDTGPTSTVFTVSSDAFVNRNGSTYIAYLFATLAGISKVGTFSHTNGSSTDVDCGFSSGSSFVIVKRTDSTGDWYNWDSVRGIVSGNDPYLLLNSTAIQNSSYDYIDTLNSGFQMASGFTTGTYFFYAIAA